MRQLIANTDVAELALYSFDHDIFEDLTNNLQKNPEKQNLVLTLSTGMDGSFNSHIYINESLAAETEAILSKDDKIEFQLNVEKGRIAFSGVEFVTNSKYELVEDDSLMDVAPGEYKVEAYRTDVPEELINNRIENELNPEEIQLVNSPGKVVVIGIGISIFLFILGMILSGVFFWAIIAVIFVVVIKVLLITKSESFKKAEKKMHAIEDEFPSIVFKLKSINNETG